MSLMRPGVIKQHKLELKMYLIEKLMSELVDTRTCLLEEESS